MDPRTTARLAAPWIAVALLVAAPAAADEDVVEGEAAAVEVLESEQRQQSPPAGTLELRPVPVDEGPTPVEAWEDSRRWSYDTAYLAPFTRNGDEVGLPQWARIALAPFTVALDVATLPLGALAGLFGA